jgi:hypothetical protein
MKKYQYTKEEHEQISKARKVGPKELSKLVSKIRKVCISEGRVTEVETKRKPKRPKVVIKKPCDKQEDETTEEQVEVHGADGQTIVITQ